MSENYSWVEKKRVRSTRKIVRLGFILAFAACVVAAAFAATMTGAAAALPANCTPPGVTVQTDPANDQTGAAVAANQQLDISSVSVGEPFMSASDQSVSFTMKVANMTGSPQPNSRWRVNFRANDTAGTPRTVYVDMTTFNTGAVAEFDYGYVTTTATGGQLATSQCGFNVVLGCPITGQSSADGTIVMKLPENTALPFFDSTGTKQFDVSVPVGASLTGITGFTELLVGAAGSGSLQV